MNLIIEMQEQITPRQVSRTVGETQNSNPDTSTVEGTDNSQVQQQQQQNNNTTT